MSDERVAFRAFLIDEHGERHEITNRSAASVASGIDDLRAAMTVAMERLRTHVVDTTRDAEIRRDPQP